MTIHWAGSGRISANPVGTSVSTKVRMDEPRVATTMMPTDGQNRRATSCHDRRAPATGPMPSMTMAGAVTENRVTHGINGR